MSTRITTADHFDDICQRIAEGNSLRAICKDLGLRESTVRDWLANHDEEFQRYTRYRELGCDALADECVEIADEKTADPACRRIRIDTRIRLLGKWSQRYADKTMHTGPDGGAIKVDATTKIDMTGLSDEQLRALASIRVPTE